MITTTAADPVTLLTPADRCDRCSVAAKVLAVLDTGGELLFCDHHARVHRTALEPIAIWSEGWS